jgi:hypothetical protein
LRQSPQPFSFRSLPPVQPLYNFFRNAAAPGSVSPPPWPPPLGGEARTRR